jgi:hypothetical protein
MVNDVLIANRGEAMDLAHGLTIGLAERIAKRGVENGLRAAESARAATLAKESHA